ncbi:hypothetical protein A3Q56_06428 [Intoshia linei]|uniref:Uncharacterized protein n=1 Tax=Intoshia linei TaxID=1819745 RepID=A0A177AXB6_9BILA|nr:hypothetical protein A3Q56_06428 [Intoshia linei]
MIFAIYLTWDAAPGLNNVIAKNLLESKRFNVKMRNSGDKIRQNNAAARKHFNNFKSELKKCKMSKENNEEQMILNLFSECVEMQREKLRGIRKRNVYLQKKELCEIDNTIKSIENFYKDKISIINENFNLKENAAKFNKIDYQKNLEKLKNDYRKMLLKDINNMDNDKFNYYNTNSNKLYREKDSNFVKNRMNILNYKR